MQTSSDESCNTVSVGGAEADCSAEADVVTSVAETEGNFTWPSLFSLILTEQDNF